MTSIWIEFFLQHYRIQIFKVALVSCNVGNTHTHNSFEQYKIEHAYENAVLFNPSKQHLLAASRSIIAIATIS